MKIEQLVTVMIRLLVAYLLMVVIFQYGMTLSALAMQNHKIGVEGNLLIYATFAIVTVLLVLIFVFATRIARAITPKGEGMAALPMSGERLEVVGFSLIGLWLLATSLPDLVQYGVYISSIDAASKRTEIAFFGNVTQFAVGVLLVLCARKIVAWVNQLRGQ